MTVPKHRENLRLFRYDFSLIFQLKIFIFLKLVGMTGFEPATSSSRTKRATGLRYIPKIYFMTDLEKKSKAANQNPANAFPTSDFRLLICIGRNDRI